jgi:hypothetical protein
MWDIALPLLAFFGLGLAFFALLFAFFAVIVAFFAFLYAHGRQQGRERHIGRPRQQGQVHDHGPLLLELANGPYVDASPCRRCDIYRNFAVITLLLKDLPKDLVQQRNQLYDTLVALVGRL